jgi:hypothetical protein
VSRVYFTDRALGKQFPAILREAGISVERHADHFADNAADEEWLAAVARKGWIALTHDQRIRYKVNQRDAVMKNRLALLVVMGKAPFADLARSFVATIARIERFLERNEPPLIAKVYRAGEAELGRRPDAPGRVDLWLTEVSWRKGL